jgi:hypothetical protein
LTLAMIEDLLKPDEQPEGKPFNGHVRLASTFQVEAVPPGGTARRGEASGAGHLVFKPLELLAGHDWLITCWHPTRTFVGAEPVGDTGEPEVPTDLLGNVGRTWAAGQAASAGDLGVLVMHELALTYIPTVRVLASWLEDWELGLYINDESDRCTLVHLWGSMAVLRDWLNPLNRPGLRTNVDKAWLPATNHAEVVAVDDRIDKALDSLRRLADALRGSFQVLHVELNQEEQERADERQRRVELAATALLVPTFVVGFYGANTWVPGEQQHWGFWVMVAALVVLSVGALCFVTYWHRQHKKDKATLAQQRLLLRDALPGRLREREGRRATA